MFELQVVSNTPMTGVDDVNVVAETLLVQIGYLPKGYRISFGDLAKAWSFTEANVNMAMENYRKTIVHFQELTQKR